MICKVNRKKAKHKIKNLNQMIYLMIFQFKDIKRLGYCSMILLTKESGILN